MKANDRTRTRILYSFGRVAGGAYDGFNNAVMALYIGALTGNPFIIGYLGNTRTIEGAVIQPVVGRWSDRISSPLGRRRPFILVAAPISVGFFVLIPMLAHTGHNTALPLVVAAIVLFSVAWNITADPYDALMVDLTPEHERPVFNSILNIVSLVGQIGIVVYVNIAALRKNQIPDDVFYACGVLMLISYAIVFFGVREPGRPADIAARQHILPLRDYVREVRECREAMKLLGAVFFLWSGSSAVMPFLTFFIVKSMHASKSQALTVYVVAVLSAALCAYPFGRLAQRFGSRRIIVIGTSMLVTASAFGLVVPSYTWLFPLAILVGAGFAATNTQMYPYLSQLVPGSKIGVFTGLRSSFEAAALPVSILATGTIIAAFGYRSIFAILGVTMLCDFALLLSIDEAAAQRQSREPARDHTLPRPLAAAVVR